MNKPPRHAQASKPTKRTQAPVTRAQSVEHPSVEISVFDNPSQQATTPLTRFNELSVRAIERAARYSYEVAGDSLSFTLANVHSVSQATDLATLLQRSSNLAHQFAAKQLQRFAELATLTTESRAEFTLWLGESASELAATSSRIPTVAVV
jgi:hypothetical protein